MDGYLCKVEYSDGWLRLWGKNKAAHFALAGPDHAGDVVVLALCDITSVQLVPAGVLLKGSLRITDNYGQVYQLQFLRQHADAFAELAHALQAGLCTTRVNPGGRPR